MRLFGDDDDIHLGNVPGLFATTRFTIPVDDIKQHGHIIGLTGSGKSRFMAHLFGELVRVGYGATLIDPHGDLAALVAAKTGARHLDIPAAYDAGRYVKLNVLRSDDDPYVVAGTVREAMHRAWPSLAGGVAPRFDKLVFGGVKLLASSGASLPQLERVLTDGVYRQRLMASETDYTIRRLWGWFDSLPQRLQLEYADSTLSRVFLLASSPVLRNSLGQEELALDVVEAMDTGQATAISLNLADGEAARLMGSLITVMYEQGAKRRSNRRPHFLLIDEFSEFSARSEEALSRILSQCRKWGLYVIMAHQTWSQASERLRGALQNVGIEIAFRLGRSDAEREALLLGRVNPEAVKHTVSEGEERSHPLFYSLPEQWEKHVQRLQELPARKFLMRLDGTKPGQIREITTPTIHDVSPDSEVLKATIMGGMFGNAVEEPQEAISRRQKL